MDRLVNIEPLEVLLQLEDLEDENESATVTIKNVLHTMPVAFKVEPLIPNKYLIKPTAIGIISPLESITLHISLLPFIPRSLKRFSIDSFQVKTVVAAAAASSSSSKNKESWFLPTKRPIYTDENLKVTLTGGLILRDAVVRGAIDEVRQVLELDPGCINGKNPEGHTALHLAVLRHRGAVAQLLLQHDARPDARDADGATPLIEAARSGQASAVELLLARGANPECTDRAGWRAVHHAATGGHRDALHALLSGPRCSHVNAAVEDGRRALHMAVLSGDTGAVLALLQHGADVTAATADGTTALHLAAAWSDSVTLPRLLLQWGAERGAVDWRGRTPRDVAREATGQLDVVALLAGEDAGEGLRGAAWRGDVTGVKAWLRRGDATARDKFGWTALHCAAFKGHVEVATLLLRAGADVGAVDVEGYTALHCAVESGYHRVVKLLVKSCLSAGVELGFKTTSGMSPLDMAVALGHDSITRLLSSAGMRAHSEFEFKN